MCAGATGLLRLPGLGYCAARDSTAVHLPPLPLRRDSGRDLEDQLQGAPGVNSLPAKSHQDGKPLKDQMNLVSQTTLIIEKHLMIVFKVERVDDNRLSAVLVANYIT